MQSIRILVVGDEENLQWLHDLRQDPDLEIRISAFDEEEVLNNITKTNAQMVILEDDGSNRFYRCCQQIYMLRPRTIPIVMIRERSPERLDKLLQTGVHHTLPVSLGTEAFIQSIKNICANETNRLISMENTSKEQNKSKIIMVHGAKDGIGKTSFVANLAIALARAGQKVAVLDLDLQYGDVNVFLGLESKTTIAELLQADTPISIDLIRQHLILHTSGVNILCAPRSPEFAEGITGAGIERILAAMRSYYDYVILDTPPQFNDVNVSCIDAASGILFFTGGDISAIRNSRKALYLMFALTRKEKIKLLLGKERENEIKPATIAQTLEFPVWASLPYDYKAVVSALNLGHPAVTNTPGAKYSKAVQSIAQMLNAGENAGRIKRSSLRLGKKAKR